MFAVVLGLLALLIGPLLGPILRDEPRLAAVIDGFVVVTVCGLVILHVLPQSVAFAGPIALVVAALGVLAPVLLHRFDARVSVGSLGTTRQLLTIGVFLAGAFIHAVLDGVALVDSAGHDHGHHHDEDESISMLAIAVLLHRIPYGLAIWIVGRQRMGTVRSVAVLGALAAGTIVGAVVGTRIFEVASVAVFATVQAFAAGAVLHVLLDAPAFDVAKHPHSSSVGVALGIGVLAVLTLSHPFVAVANEELAFGSTVLTMAAESAPALLLALLGLGVLGAWGPRLRLPLWGRGPLAVQALSGVVAGLPAPLCTCTVAPTFERLVRRRVGLAAAVALLVSVPELALPSTVLSFELLGPSLTIARLLGAVVVAVVAGIFVALASRSQSPSLEQAETGTIDTPARSWWPATLHAVDHVLPWVLLGVVLAAFFEPLLTTTALTVLPRWAEVPVYGLLGVPFYVCATGSTPIVAVLVHKGASAGAVIAFLLAAPATNLATLAIVTRLLSKRVAVVFAVAVYVAAVVVGFGVNAAVDAGILTLPSLHKDAGHAHGAVELGALAVLLILMVLSLWRQGARGFLGQILKSLDDAKGGHVHGPHCGHAGFARPGFIKTAPVARVRVDFARIPPAPPAT